MKQDKIPITAFRYYDQMYSGVSISPSGSESYYSIGPKIELREYPILKHTPKGFWIAGDFTLNGFLSTANRDKRFILNSSRRKFAHTSREDALKSFIARKRRQIAILMKQMDIANKAWEEACKIVL